MSNNKNHSEQFERYLKGQMSPQEAHAFEREVLDDPFAQEALEGYESQGANAVHDVEQLRSRIQGKQKNTWPWMRIASVIALLIVGSFTVYFFTDQIEGEQLAMEEESIEELSQSSPKSDTIRIDSKKEIQVAEDIQTDTFKKDGLKVASKNEDVVFLAEENSALEKEVDGSEIDEIIPDTFEEVAPLEGKDKTILLAEVEEAMAKPASDEMIVLEQEIAVPEQTFTAKKKESVEADRPALARSTSQNSGIAAELKDEESVNKPARPAIGDSLYQRYLQQELIYPEAAKKNNIEGEVIISLAIDAFGNITDIQIKKSLGYGCDKEAIRLVEEGPKWNAAETNSIQVSDTVGVNIQFKLSH